MPDAFTTRPGATWQRRVPVLLTVVYVATLSVWTERGREPDAWLGSIAAAVLAVLASRRTGVVGVVSWGLAVVVASLGSARASASLQACGSVGVLACACAACFAIVHVSGDGGVIPARRLPVRFSVAALGVAWSAGLVAPLFPAARPMAWLAEHPASSDAVALALSAGVLAALTRGTIRARRLELAVVERAMSAGRIQAIAVGVAAFLALFAPAHADAIARLALCLASAGVVAVFVHPDAVRVARSVRRATALAIVGGGVVLVGACAAQGRSGWPVTVITAAIALAVGSWAAAIERPFRPAAGAWLDAFESARKAADRAEGDDAVRAVLLVLRSAHGLGESSPELWTLAPGTQTTVDAAGYLRERASELPDAMIAVAASEPEGTLRSDVLEALEVRRPDLRPLCAWMTARGALLAALVTCGSEPEGILILPRGKRSERLTLEEVQAVKGVADCLAAACHSRAVAARMRARVQEAAGRVKACEAQAERLERGRARLDGRSMHAEGRLAHAADVGLYSASSRMAVESLERRLGSGGPVVVRAPSGLDVASFLARAHLASTRRAAPLVLVDGTDPHEHEPARWRDAAQSPLVLADGGILALVDGCALPLEIQALVGGACQKRHAPWDSHRLLDLQLVVTTVGGTEDSPQFDELLAVALGDAFTSPVILPRLSERADDFRALLMDLLAREGLRAAGRALGIEPPAYARLAEYDFPGDVAELVVVVRRLVERCRGDTVRAVDVESLGLRGLEVRSSAAGDVRGRVRKDPISA